MAESKAVNIEPKPFDPEGGLKKKLNPVILLHAMLCSKEVWVDIAQRVANATERRVYTYDARNHGDSPATTKSNFSFNVDDLFGVMDKITAEMDHSPQQFVVVGHDMGGMTAIGAALHEDEEMRKRLEMVIVVDMYVKNIPLTLIERVQIFAKDWADCVRRVPGETEMEKVTSVSVDNLYKKLADFMKEKNEEVSYKKVNHSFKKTGNQYEVKYHTENIDKALAELKKRKEYPDTNKFEGPAYFFYGSKSHYDVESHEKDIRKHFERVKFVKFEDGSHFFIADVPVEFAEKLSKKIKGAA